MPTSYRDFRDSYATRNNKLWEPLEIIYGDVIENDMWWCNFEQMLGEIDYNHLFNSHNGMALGFQKVKNFLVGALPPFFGEWIREIDGRRIDVSPKPELGIETDSQFFTFNYTSVLEKVYHVDPENVWHIHGSVTDRNGNNHPVVGHDNDERKMFCYLQEYKKTNQISHNDLTNTVNQSAAKGAKGVENRTIQNEGLFRERYAEIEQFIAMGFSFNEIDMPYIKKMIDANRDISSTNWKIYWHNDGDAETFQTKLLENGIHTSQLNFERW